ncbi:HAD family hydrolase [Saccharibacillus alkalitolerans]|uniref:HAD family hydrolase n=1 Tax=Saccharibacillus alkalitolerans TaxID=2705290 RepID=A0ABX0FCG2_9BACL|nr:HAD family hydrolase [Saccharibacillus alkalitolerans]NGZ77204.1 HAD family hydrolase [Saccharibacillus alkalitolerans]
MYNFIFDIDDTVYDQIIPFKKAFDRNFAQYAALSLDDLYRHNRHFSDEVFEQTVRGEMTLEDMHAYRITEAFRVMGIEISREEALRFQRDYAAAQGELEPTPDMREALDYCRDRGLKCGVITNGPAEHQRKKVKQLGIYDWIKRENVVVSGELEFMKPDVRIFRHVERLLGIKPENTYYIGDSYANDIVGAKGAGWKAIWIDRRGTRVPEGGMQPDITLRGKDSVAAAIRGICEMETESVT